jgi:hypothetical protein
VIRFINKSSINHLNPHYHLRSFARVEESRKSPEIPTWCFREAVDNWKFKLIECWVFTSINLVNLSLVKSAFALESSKDTFVISKFEQESMVYIEDRVVKTYLKEIRIAVEIHNFRRVSGVFV